MSEKAKSHILHFLPFSLKRRAVFANKRTSAFWSQLYSTVCVHLYLLSTFPHDFLRLLIKKTLTGTKSWEKFRRWSGPIYTVYCRQKFSVHCILYSVHDKIILLYALWRPFIIREQQPCMKKFFLNELSLFFIC